MLETLFYNKSLLTRTGLETYDGDTFTLDDSINPPVTFEFDSGFNLHVHPAGGNEANGGLRDGVQFSITDGTTTARFEFDKDGVVTPGYRRIFISDVDGPAAVARLVQNAILSNPASAQLGLNPRLVNGGQLALGGRAGQMLSISPGAALTQSPSVPAILDVPSQGGAARFGGVADGSTITITNGVTTATFEFDKDGLVTTGNFGVAIAETSTSLQVAQSLAARIRQYIFLNAGAAASLGITAANTDVLVNGAVYVAPNPVLATDRVSVRIGGNPSAIISTSEGNNVSQPLPEPGVSPAVSLTVPDTLRMQLPEAFTIHVPVAGGGVGGIQDGEIFRVGFAQFEFDNNGVVVTDSAGSPVNDVIPFTTASTAEDIAQAIRDAIAGVTGLGLDPTRLGGVANIDLGGTRGSLALPVNSPLIQTGPFSLQIPLAAAGVGGIVEGDTFTLTVDIGPDNAPNVVQQIFEFDTDGIRTNPLSGSILVPFAATDSRDTIAQSVIDAVRNAGLGLEPVRIDGTPRVELPGLTSTTVVTFDPTGTSAVNTHLTQTGQLGSISDAQQFVMTDGTNTVRFEFDSNGSFSPNVTPIRFNVDSTRDQIAAEIARQVAASGLGLNPLIRATDPQANLAKALERGEVQFGGSTNHQLDTQLTRATQSGVGGAIQDGDSFTITAPGVSFTFEFDNDGSPVDPLSGNILVPFSVDDTRQAIIDSLIQTVINSGAGVIPTDEGEGVISLNGTPNHILDVTGANGRLLKAGLDGGARQHVPISFVPSADFQGAAMAQAIRTAVNTTAVNLSVPLNVTASISQFDTARVELTHTSGVSSDLTLLPGMFQLGTLPVSLEGDLNGDFVLDVIDTNGLDIVKQDEDLLRIIGHRVFDGGPLGLEVRTAGDLGVLAADDFSAHTGNPFSPLSYTNLQGQANQFEGVYIDDIVIGFAERGEQGSSSTANATFVANPLTPGGQILDGPYQLEIRGAANFQGPAGGSLDTNDRNTSGFTLIAQPGSAVYDGQTFTLNDGDRTVVFEYHDVTMNVDSTNPTPQPGTVLNPADYLLGHQVVPYRPTDPDYVIAKTIRDVINGADVQEVLNVVAGIADGTVVGTGLAGLSTSNRVNLYGLSDLKTHATPVIEYNDQIRDATPTMIDTMASASFLADGAIGDNFDLPLDPGLDVDLFRMDLAFGELVRIDIDADEIGSTLDALLQVFDSAGNVVPGFDANFNPILFSDDNSAPGEFARLDPFMFFRAPATGTYYVGVSGFGNLNYDPNIQHSGTRGDTGFYQMEITFGDHTNADFIAFNDIGDSNRFRDQGQLILAGNTIYDSDDFAIDVNPGPRASNTPNDTSPQQGPVRNLREINDNNWAPGVVIMNNLIDTATGGIRYSGSTNNAGEQVGAVPFGRIINNTVFTGFQAPPQPTTTQADIVFMIDTSGTMGGDIAEIRQRLSTFDQQMIAANIDAQYGLVTFPASNPNNQPRQIQDIVDFATFTAAGSPFHHVPNCSYRKR
ncbi:MAG: pre-peptidase C-terminal domain-containing protein [Pirellulaceae bacterium]